MVRETSFPYNSDLVPVADRAISKPRTMPQLRAFAITNLTLYSISHIFPYRYSSKTKISRMEA